MACLWNVWAWLLILSYKLFIFYVFLLFRQFLKAKEYLMLARYFYLLKYVRETQHKWIILYFCNYHVIFKRLRQHINMEWKLIDKNPSNDLTISEQIIVLQSQVHIETIAKFNMFFFIMF
jgi:hypothetical protein